MVAVVGFPVLLRKHPIPHPQRLPWSHEYGTVFKKLWARWEERVARLLSACGPTPPTSSRSLAMPRVSISRGAEEGLVGCSCCCCDRAARSSQRADFLSDLFDLGGFMLRGQTLASCCCKDAKWGGGRLHSQKGASCCCKDAKWGQTLASCCYKGATRGGGSV